MGAGAVGDGKGGASVGAGVAVGGLSRRQLAGRARSQWAKASTGWPSRRQLAGRAQAQWATPQADARWKHPAGARRRRRPRAGRTRGGHRSSAWRLLLMGILHSPHVMDRASQKRPAGRLEVGMRAIGAWAARSPYQSVVLGARRARCLPKAAMGMPAAGPLGSTLRCPPRRPPPLPPPARRGWRSPRQRPWPPAPPARPRSAGRSRRRCRPPESHRRCPS
jgi:hypothetical protein